MTGNKITIDEVADMLGASNIPPEIDYNIKECATKGCWQLFIFTKINLTTKIKRLFYGELNE